MGRFDAIKNSINAEIRQNGKKEITGQVMNGVLNGMVDSVDSALTEMEDSLGRDLEGKVDAVEGKGLSSNDYTDAEREKLASLKNYDDSGIKEELKKKQDAIEDLDAIRQGASKGATALQEVPQEYAKKTDVANGLSGKVDKVAGKGLSTYDFNDSMVKAIERAGNEPIPIRWEDLKDLRDNNELIPGRLYRITDYTTTTTQENTKSAGHRFDIIVLALNDHTLAEEAWAIYSEEDSYFADHGANLSAWKIWYCFDNNRERFAWADEDGGKGVIYRMIDEWGNDCPYDFKNIQFKRGIYADGGGIAKEEGDEDYEVFCYTFSWEDETHLVIMDASIFGNNGRLLNDEGQINGVYGNTIKSYINYTGEFETPSVAQQHLNNIVFLSTFGYEEGRFYGCYGNSFGNNCHSNSFGNNCHSNSFGNDCNYNSFGNECFSNSFGNVCHDNSFGNDCYDNSFGNGCADNTFVDMIDSMHGLSYNRFDNGVRDVQVYVDRMPDEYESVRYNHVCSGVSRNIEFYADETYGRTYAINSDGYVRELVLGDLA